MKSTRVNLAIPLDLAIQIEKECDKRGIDRANYIRESVYEKLKKSETSDGLKENYKLLSEEITDVKRIMMLVLDKLNR